MLAGTLAAATFAVLAVPSASLGAVTIGSSLEAASTNLVPPNPQGYSLIQTQLPGRQITSPVNGVVVRWRIRTGPGTTAQPINLRVLRVAGAQYSGVNTSETRTLSSLATTQTFDTRLAVRSGDYIGLNCCRATAGILRTLTGFTLGVFLPPLANGETRAAIGTISRELALNADVEADADADGFGDETQDRCPTDATRQQGCGEPTLASFRISSRLVRTSLVVSYRLNQAARVRFVVRDARGAHAERSPSPTRRAPTRSGSWPGASPDGACGPGATRCRSRRPTRRVSARRWRCAGSSSAGSGRRQSRQDGSARGGASAILMPYAPVSYTHLTLPTICSV